MRASVSTNDVRRLTETSQRLAHAARVQDFCMRDLALPESERTRNILSAIINFIKFAEERGTFLKKLRDQSTSALSERERIEQQVAELKQKIAEIKYAINSSSLPEHQTDRPTVNSARWMNRAV